MDAGDVPVPPSSDAGPDVSDLGRIPGAFFSPVATFESIARRPTWIAPLLLWTALSVGITAVLLPKIKYEQLVREAMQKRGQTVSEDRITSIVEQQKKFSIWSVCLFVIGFAAAAKIRRGAAAGVLVTLWLIAVAIGVAWNAIF